MIELFRFLVVKKDGYIFTLLTIYLVLFCPITDLGIIEKMLHVLLCYCVGHATQGEWYCPGRLYCITLTMPTD